MKKITLLITSIFYLFFTKVFADQGILKGISESKIRNGDVHMEDIPLVIKNAIDLLMGIAGTVSIIFIIFGAYQMLLGSLEKDLTKGRNTIYYALMGFVVSACSWLFIRFILDNFMG